MVSIIKVNEIQDTSGTSAMTIDSSGRVLMPSKPAFRAYQAASNWTSTGTAEKMKLNATLFDVGSNFDTTNYRFVAPVDGVYHFSGSSNAYSITSGNYFRSELRINGGSGTDDILVGTYFRSGDTGDHNVTISATIELDANDYVEWYNVSNDTSRTFSSGSRWNWLSGFLVS